MERPHFSLPKPNWASSPIPSSFIFPLAHKPYSKVVSDLKTLLALSILFPRQLPFHKRDRERSLYQTFRNIWRQNTAPSTLPKMDWVGPSRCISPLLAHPNSNTLHEQWIWWSCSRIKEGRGTLEDDRSDKGERWGGRGRTLCVWMRERESIDFSSDHVWCWERQQLRPCIQVSSIRPESGKPRRKKGKLPPLTPISCDAISFVSYKRTPCFHNFSCNQYLLWVVEGDTTNWITASRLLTSHSQLPTMFLFQLNSIKRNLPYKVNRTVKVLNNHSPEVLTAMWFCVVTG